MNNAPGASTLRGVAALQAFVGKRGPAFIGPDAVNAPMIRHWCAAIGDRNPVYTDPKIAAGSVWQGVIAPPAMLQVWVMPGFGVAPPADDPVGEFHALAQAQGYSSIVATNCEQEYRRPLRPGDRVQVTRQIESVSGEKKTALGIGIFLTTRFAFSDQDGAPVASMLHRVLRFKPPAAAISAARPAASTEVAASEPGADLPVVMQGSERAIGFPGAGPLELPPTLQGRQVQPGARLAALEVPLTRTAIVAGAMATRDYQDVHHDPELARQRGSPDIFLNILSTTGLVGRFVTDVFGPDAILRKLAIRLGATAYPGDTLVIAGIVVRKSESAAGCEIVVSVRGTVSRGDHVTGEVTLTLPAAKRERARGAGQE